MRLGAEQVEPEHLLLALAEWDGPARARDRRGGHGCRRDHRRHRGRPRRDARGRRRAVRPCSTPRPCARAPTGRASACTRSPRWSRRCARRSAAASAGSAPSTSCSARCALPAPTLGARARPPRRRARAARDPRRGGGRRRAPGEHVKPRPQDLVGRGLNVETRGRGSTTGGPGRCDGAVALAVFPRETKGGLSWRMSDPTPPTSCRQITGRLNAAEAVIRSGSRERRPARCSGALR